MNIRLYYLFIVTFFSVAPIHAMHNLDLSRLPAGERIAFTRVFKGLVEDLTPFFEGAGGNDKLNLCRLGGTLMEGKELTDWFCKLIRAIAHAQHDKLLVSAIIDKVARNEGKIWTSEFIQAKAVDLCTRFKERAKVYAVAEDNIRRINHPGGSANFVSAPHYDAPPDVASNALRSLRRFFMAVGIVTGVVGITVIGWKIIKHYRDKKYKEKYT